MLALVWLDVAAIISLTCLSDKTCGAWSISFLITFRSITLLVSKAFLVSSINFLVLNILPINLKSLPNAPLLGVLPTAELPAPAKSPGFNILLASLPKTFTKLLVRKSLNCWLPSAVLGILPPIISSISALTPVLLNINLGLPLAISTLALALTSGLISISASTTSLATTLPKFLAYISNKPFIVWASADLGTKSGSTLPSLIPTASKNVLRS